MELIKLHADNKKIWMPAADIIRIEAVSNYSRIYFANGNSIVVAKVLHLLQDLLPATMFVRVHRSHLVNRLFVTAIKESDSKKIRMKSGEYIVVSRSNRESLKTNFETAEVLL
jgi:two-component system LytT family response regulator